MENNTDLKIKSYDSLSHVYSETDEKTVRFFSCEFEGFSLQSVDKSLFFQDCKFGEIDFSYMIYERLYSAVYKFKRCRLVGCKFTTMTMPFIEFEDCEFYNCYFSEITMSSAGFNRCKFNDCEFLNIKTFQTKFFGSTFICCNFFNVNVFAVDCRTRHVFSNCDFEKTRFSRCEFPPKIFWRCYVS